MKHERQSETPEYQPHEAGNSGAPAALASDLPGIVLGRAGRRIADNRLPAIVAAIRGADLDSTLQANCVRLEGMRAHAPRGRTGRLPSSVTMLLTRAGKLGLLGSCPLWRTD